MKPARADEVDASLRQPRARYWRLWRALRWRWRVVWILRFNAIIAAVSAGVIVLPDQGREALQVLVQDGADRPFPLALNCAAAMLLGLSLWYWSLNTLWVIEDVLTRTGARPERVREEAANPGASRFAHACCRALGVSPLVAIAAGLLVRAWEVGGSMTPATRAASLDAIWGLLYGAGVAGGLGAAMLAGFAGWRVRTDLAGHAAPGRLSWLPGWLYRVVGLWFGLASVPKTAQVLLPGMLFAGAGVLVLFTLRPSAAASWGPLAVVMTASIFWVAIGSPLVIASQRFRAPVLMLFFGLTATLFGLFNWNDNHRVRALPGPSATPAGTAQTPGPGATNASRVDPSDSALARDFSAWLAARPGRDEPGEFHVFVVAAEGGGIRNAYLTASVLGRLDTIPRFRERLYAVSGVSGGSVGAAVHAAGVAAVERGAAINVRDTSRGVLSEDLLSPVLGMALYPDLVQRFLPVPIPPFDRARALERTLEQAFEARGAPGVADAPLDALRPTPASDAPLLLLNATLVQTGERVVVAPLAPWAGGPSTLPGIRPDLRLRLSTAAFLSARFPIVTPSGRVDAGGPARRLVDGGYFENSGAATALDVVRAIAARASQTRDAGSPVRIHVILVAYLPSSPPQPPGSAFEEALSPLNAMLQAREARGRSSVSELGQYLREASAEGKPVGARLLRATVTDQGPPLPLGWLMSRDARRRIDEQVDAGAKPDGDSGAEAWVRELLGAPRGP